MDKYYKKITAHPPWFSLRFKEVWQYRELVLMLTKRTFMVRYRQTLLGPFWLLFVPLFRCFFIFLVFGKIAHLSTGNVPPFLFYLTGSAVWTFFSGCLMKNAGTFRNNAYLFSKVYFPRLCMPISYIFSDLIDFIFVMVIVFLLTGYYGIAGMLQFSCLRALLIMPIMFFLGLMAMSIGILISSLTTKYRDFAVLLEYILTLWMPLTPIAYPLHDITNPVLLKLFYLNPVTGLMELFRYAMFGDGQILIGNLIYSCSFTIAATCFGIIVFNRIERNFTDTI